MEKIRKKEIYSISLVTRTKLTKKIKKNKIIY